MHFGNFRDVSTTLMVVQALRQRGKNARFIFSWDDFDRFRKVPQGVDPSFAQHIGKPLSAVPDPLGELESYARRFASEFENSMRAMGVELDYRYQTDEYRSGRYDQLILHALRTRRQIAETLLGHMSEKEQEREEHRRRTVLRNLLSGFRILAIHRQGQHSRTLFRRRIRLDHLLMH